MSGQVQFYVNGIHSVGGVTTWSFQAASFLASRYRTQVVTINSGSQRPDDLFPGHVTEVWRRTPDRSGAPTQQSKQTQPELPTKPDKPVKRVKKPKKSTKPTLPTKPTKLPIEPPTENGQASSDAERISSAVSSLAQASPKLHPTATQAILDADLFIPNYLHFAYELAARSRAHGFESRCIGVCHCDQDNYYQLLTHYAPIIHSFIAVSPRCLNNLVERLPERANDMHLVPYGVAPPEPNPHIRVQGPLRLLYAGRIVRQQKRVFDLVDIVKELDQLGVDYVLDIVGVGPDRKMLFSQLEDASRVQFRPGVSHTEITSVYRNHDVFLLPSETEGTSIALLESMAHGLVPVVTRVSGSEDVIAEGVNGFLADVGDVQQMATSIARLATNYDLLRRLALAARETVVHNYRIDRQLSAFESCLQQTMNKPLMSVNAARAVLDSPLQKAR